MFPQQLWRRITGGRERPRQLPDRSTGRWPVTAVRTWAFGSLPGRSLLAAILVKLLLAPFAVEGDPPGVLGVVDAAATIVVLVVAGYILVRVLDGVRRRLLWRVRRKLILSYVFIGFVPVLLIVAFFLLAGVLMFLNVSSYLVKGGFDDLVEEAVVLAETTVTEIERGPGLVGANAVLESKLATTIERHPGVSLAIVPTGAAGAGSSAGSRVVRPMVVGPWHHLESPGDLPTWIGQAGFGGLLAYTRPDDDRTELVARAAGLARSPNPRYAVIVDLPVEEQTGDRMREATGIKLGTTVVVPSGGEEVAPVTGRAGNAASSPADIDTGIEEPWALDWVTFFDYTDWATGREGQVSMAIQVRIADIYDRISGAQATLGTVSLGDLFLLVLTIIGGLFLVIECAALVMGFALAKSITGSVHELFMGTEKVRAGNFAHRIRVQTRDQLGELAESFNSMTGSIKTLLEQAAEKKRLEEELRIAREIQMSLLPSGPTTLPGVGVTAVCVPAREVGGDYYDFFSLGDRRLGILIVDVSGKGTSAAFYMAELKGLVLSLSQIYHSPKQLMIEVNRIISDNLDTRSFITMMYAVLDLDAATLTYARAGHTPLIYLPATGMRREARVLAPDGLVLGLRFDGIQEKFDQLLEESTLSIAPGDVFALYTDGVTEAMNDADDFFGESRLSRVLEAHSHLSSDELRERILHEVDAFVGGAVQHDDMTMILVKIDKAARLAAPGGPTAVAV